MDALKTELESYRKRLKILQYNIETIKTEIFHSTRLLEKTRNDRIDNQDMENTKIINDCNVEIQKYEAEVKILKSKIADLEKKLLPFEIMTGMKFK